MISLSPLIINRLALLVAISLLLTGCIGMVVGAVVDTTIRGGQSAI